MSDIQRLKAEAYDLLVTIQNTQAALNAKNQEIAAALGQPQPNGIAEPAVTGS